MWQLMTALCLLGLHYMREHLRRFGHYVLDMEETPPPLEPKPVPITG
jgi:hypothetical protein